MIKAPRTCAGLTQAQVAERRGTTQSVIARLESGATKPSLRTLEPLRPCDRIAPGGEAGAGARRSVKPRKRRTVPSPPPAPWAFKPKFPVLSATTH